MRKQVQETAYKALLNNNTSSKVGAVVAIDPTTGAILAMASTPSYDPNPLVSHDFDAAQEAYDKLETGPGQAAAQPGACRRRSRPARPSRWWSRRPRCRTALNPASALTGGGQLHRAGHDDADQQLARRELPRTDHPG